MQELTQRRELPSTEISGIKQLCTSQILFNKYDLDVISALLERGATFSLDSKDFIYVGEYADPKVDYVFLENATKYTSAHLILLLNKFKNAQIVLFLSKDDENKLGLEKNIIDTNENELNIENLRRVAKKRKLSQCFSASDVLNDILTELERRVQLFE